MKRNECMLFNPENASSQLTLFTCSDDDFARKCQWIITILAKLLAICLDHIKAQKCLLLLILPFTTTLKEGNLYIPKLVM